MLSSLSGDQGRGQTVVNRLMSALFGLVLGLLVLLMSPGLWASIFGG